MTILSSLQNPIVKHMAKLAKDAAYRKSTGCIYVEGKKIIAELQKSPFVKQVFTTLLATSIPNEVQISEAIAKKVSPFVSSEGVFAEVKRPKNEPLADCQNILVCDQIKDPGNLGTLIRSAVAFGYDGVFILENSTDPFSPKAIRASMGAVFKIKIFEGSYLEFSELIKQTQHPVVVADAQGQNLKSIPQKRSHALVLGNESNGPNFKALPKHTLVSIPIQNVESLNVAIAGSLLMHHLGSFACP